MIVPLWETISQIGTRLIGYLFACLVYVVEPPVNPQNLDFFLYSVPSVEASYVL